MNIIIANSTIEMTVEMMKQFIQAKAGLRLTVVLFYLGKTRLVVIGQAGGWSTEQILSELGATQCAGSATLHYRNGILETVNGNHSFLEIDDQNIQRIIEAFE